MALETVPKFQFQVLPRFYENNRESTIETIVFGEDSNENYRTEVYSCLGSADILTGNMSSSEIRKPKYVISQGMDDKSMFLHEVREYEGVMCYVPIDMIYNIIPEFVKRVYTYDGLNVIT